MSSFKYSPFDLERPGIRLLRLLKGEDPLIECELFQAWHDGDETDSIPYEALSYTWGGTDMSASVQIGLQVHNVTENLYLALQHLRYRDEDRILWVDAICIDQSNLQERGHQVNQMKNIYSKADRVLIWLGPATDDTDILLDSLKQLERKSRRYWTIEDNRWLETWSSLQLEMQTGYWDLANRQAAGLKSLLERPWFKRVWILQEVANAGRAIVLSGTKSVSARVFAIAPLLLEVHPKPHCQALLDIMPGWSRESSWWSAQRDLRTLLFKFRASEAGDARDRIYALLGIASDGQDGYGLRVDYTKDLSQVVNDTMVFLFHGNDGSHTINSLVDSIFVDTMRSLKTMGRTEGQMWASEILRSQYRGSVNADVIESAAENVHFGQELMSHLLKQGGANVKITSNVLTAAEQNEGGEEILETLFRERGDEILVMLAGPGHERATSYLLEHQEIKIKLSGELVFAAAAHPVYGWRVLCAFLKQSVNKVEVKDGAFDVAKYVMQNLARSLDTGIIKMGKMGWLIPKDVSPSEFSLQWDPDIFRNGWHDEEWWPAFDDSWVKWLNEISNRTRLDERRKANVRRPQDRSLKLNGKELETMYNGWKDVLQLLWSRISTDNMSHFRLMVENHGKRRPEGSDVEERMAWEPAEGACK